MKKSKNKNKMLIFIGVLVAIAGLIFWRKSNFEHFQKWATDYHPSYLGAIANYWYRLSQGFTAGNGNDREQQSYWIGQWIAYKRENLLW